MKKKKSTLSAKHKAFADAYLETMNATAAYMEVYKVGRESAWRQGSRLLRNVEVTQYISEQLEDRHMGKQEVLTRLTAIARASLSPFIRVQGKSIWFDFGNPEAKAYLFLVKNIKAKRKVTEISGVKVIKSITDEWAEVELHDAAAALTMLGKYHKLFTDRVEQHNHLHVEDLDKIMELVYGKG